MERHRRFAETDDGFEIAEADLALRGPGDLTGARQSGLPLLRVASPATDLHLIEQARTFARDVCQADPRLSHPAHARLRAAVDFAQHLWAAG
jgi:ATP-dependent DNA helicase RecG